MRRFGLLLSLMAIMLVGVLALGVQPRAIAQEATPGAEEMMPEGITFEPLAFAMGVEVVSPTDLIVVRLGLEPGTGFPLEESDPSSGILVVESGVFTVWAEAPLSVSRGGSLSGAIATEEAGGEFAPAMEDVAVGEEVTLEAGDSVYIPASINGEIRNDGQERAVGLAFLVAPPEGMMGEATPAP